MVNKLKKILFKRSEGFENLKTPQNMEARFELSYKDLKIGYLSLANGEWSFAYSNEFKKQNRLLPMIDFPDVNKVYESEELWPFFTSRIPSQSQPEIQFAIRQNKIDGDNEVSLLEFFGRRTITNPFLLELA
jgi:HipA-like protein